MAEFSKSQVDRLGERLKIAPISEQDLRMLDEYRHSFRNAYEMVVDALRRDLLLDVTGRPAKSTTSIVAKLLRESIRLTQIQDIAGCRTVVSNIAEQDLVTGDLVKIFPEATLIDRRARPSHGYRAIHFIPRIAGKAVEIQVRTRLQHLWAESSERFADFLGAELKYGGGPIEAREVLDTNSQIVNEFENIQRRAANVNKPVGSNTDIGRELAQIEQKLTDKLAQLIRVLEELGRGHR